MNRVDITKKAIILHNPRCPISRAVLAAIDDSDRAAEVVEYLKNPLERVELIRIIVSLQCAPRDLLRKKETIYRELELKDDSIDDNALLDAMLAHPILIERPIVMTEKGVRLCRPKERIFEIL